MSSISIRVFLGLAGLVLLPSCSSTGSYFVAKQEPWRAQEERACIASGMVRETPYIRSRSALGGPSACGAEQPFEMAAAYRGRVRLKPAALLRCSMIPQVDRWVATVIEPNARRNFGVSVAEVKVAGSYACRPMNNKVGGNLSEHGHANALDESGFILADGRHISVKRGWRGSWTERKFLRAVHKGACAQFSTVLGPDYDTNHHDHFHVDLKCRGRYGERRVCK